MALVAKKGLVEGEASALERESSLTANTQALESGSQCSDLSSAGLCDLELPCI